MKFSDQDKLLQAWKARTKKVAVHRRNLFWATRYLFRTQDFGEYSTRIKKARFGEDRENRHFQGFCREVLGVNLQFHWAGKDCCVVMERGRQSMNLKPVAFGEVPAGSTAELMVYSYSKEKREQRFRNKQREWLIKAEQAREVSLLALTSYTKLKAEIEGLLATMTVTPRARGLKGIPMDERPILARINALRKQMYRQKRIYEGQRRVAERYGGWVLHGTGRKKGRA